MSPCVAEISAADDAKEPRRGRARTESPESRSANPICIQQSAGAARAARDPPLAFRRGSAMMSGMAMSARPRGGTILMAVLGAAALLLYLWFVSLDFASLSSPGDGVVGQAYAIFAVLALLWGMLLVLVVMDRMLGGPSWPRRAGFLQVPVAGIATLFATDYPGNRLCQLDIMALPLLIGAYLLLGRLPPRHAAWAQAAALLGVAALSVYPIVRFAS
jgi:hypothetical protein